MEHNRLACAALAFAVLASVDSGLSPLRAADNAVKVVDAEIREGLPASARFYPAFLSAMVVQSPTVKVRAKDDSRFGADIQIRYSQEYLSFVLDVHDPTADAYGAGKQMLTGDSVQLSIDTEPDKVKQGYDQSCCELAFAVSDAGEVLRRAVHIGRPAHFDWAKVQLRGKRGKTGYRVEVSIPWPMISRKLTHPPRHFSANVRVNDGADRNPRRFVQWTPGLGEKKDTSQFAHVVRVRSDKQKTVAQIFPDRTVYGRGDAIDARYVEYNRSSRPAETGKLVLSPPDRKAFDVSGVSLPQAPADSTRLTTFSLPVKAFQTEGRYRLAVEIRPRKSKKKTTGRGVLLRADAETRRRILLELGRAREHLAGVDKRVESNTALAADSYVRLGAAVARRFLVRVTSGGRDGKQPAAWSLLQLEEARRVLERTEEDIRRVLRRGARRVPPRRYYGGYGHFDEVSWDIPSFADMGTMLIQQQRGPGHMNADGSVGPGAASLLRTFQLANEYGVKVDLLLAPHNFPGWAVKAAPDITDVTPSGFIWFNVDHPTWREVMEKWIDRIIPLVKDSPALFGVCLSNEPTYRNSGRDRYSRPKWIDYLKRHHDDIASLNALYGTTYARFDEVPVPDVPKKAPKDTEKIRALYDWTRFNCENFAAWHEWMHNCIKRNAPGVKTHAKIMPYVFTRHGLLRGIDPELICRFTDIAGNDSDSFLRKPSRWPYVYKWQTQQMWYDLLHSFRGQDVFNSENHPVRDNGAPVHVPPAHTRATLWQGALHHQTATTIWAWFEPNYQRYKGLIVMRPANVYEVGRTMLDLNRLSDEMTAVSGAKPRVAILYSIPSVFWERNGMKQCIKAVYTSLTFMGQPVTFITERQLTAGRYADVDWIVVPRATHVSDAAVAELKRYSARTGKLVFVGKSNLAWDEYHRKHDLRGAFKRAVRLDVKLKEKAVFSPLREAFAKGGLSTVALHDAKTGKPAWGIEYRIVPFRGRLLVPMINFLHDPLTVSLDMKGQAIDLVTDRPIELDRITLKPMEAILISVTTGKG